MRVMQYLIMHKMGPNRNYWNMVKLISDADQNKLRL